MLSVLLVPACERFVSARSDAPDAAADPLLPAAALAGGVAVVDESVDALPAAELLRLLLVFVDALPEEALCEFVLGADAARSLDVDVPLD